jgi:hypothetical protein
VSDNKIRSEVMNEMNNAYGMVVEDEAAF